MAVIIPRNDHRAVWYSLLGLGIGLLADVLYPVSHHPFRYSHAFFTGMLLMSIPIGLVCWGVWRGHYWAKAVVIAVTLFGLTRVVLTLLSLSELHIPAMAFRFGWVIISLTLRLVGVGILARDLLRRPTASETPESVTAPRPFFLQLTAEQDLLVAAGLYFVLVAMYVVPALYDVLANPLGPVGHQGTGTEDLVIKTLVCLLFLSAFVWLGAGLRASRKWAKVVFGLLLGAALFSFFQSLPALLDRSAYIWAYYLLPPVLMLGAAYFLFRRSFTPRPVAVDADSV